MHVALWHRNSGHNSQIPVYLGPFNQFGSRLLASIGGMRATIQTAMANYCTYYCLENPMCDMLHPEKDDKKTSGICIPSQKMLEGLSNKFWSVLIHWSNNHHMMCMLHRHHWIWWLGLVYSMSDACIPKGYSPWDTGKQISRITMAWTCIQNVR